MTSQITMFIQVSKNYDHHSWLNFNIPRISKKLCICRRTSLCYVRLMARQWCLSSVCLSSVTTDRQTTDIWGIEEHAYAHYTFLLCFALLCDVHAFSRASPRFSKWGGGNFASGVSKIFFDPPPLFGQWGGKILLR